MKLAIWNTPVAEFLISGLVASTASAGVEVVRDGPRACVSLLESHAVDVALVPTISPLRDPDAYDLIPAIALSSWAYPYARLFLRGTLGNPIRSVAFDPLYANEAVLTRIILKEQYGSDPAFVPYPSPSAENLLGATEDASLIVGNDVPLIRTERLALDLGQEWYELSSYPMVWGLFATLKGRARPELVRLLRDAIELTESRRSVWIRAQEMPPTLHEFYAEELRVRLDDLAIASLTELAHQLYAVSVLDEVAELPFVELPEDDESGDPREPLL